MPIYQAPVKDIQFTLHDVLDFVPTLQSQTGQEGLDRETVDSIVEEAGRFCSEVLFPTNWPGDQQGCLFDAQSNAVRPPAAFRQAYRHFTEGGGQH